jgi:hypothetical protein
VGVAGDEVDVAEDGLLVAPRKAFDFLEDPPELGVLVQVGRVTGSAT